MSLGRKKKSPTVCVLSSLQAVFPLLRSTVLHEIYLSPSYGSTLLWRRQRIRRWWSGRHRSTYWYGVQPKMAWFQLYICEFEHFFSSFFFASRLQTTALPVACLSRGSGCLVRVWRLWKRVNYTWYFCPLRMKQVRVGWNINVCTIYWIFLNDCLSLTNKLVNVWYRESPRRRTGILSTFCVSRP